MHAVTVHAPGREPRSLPFAPGRTVAQAVYLSGLWPAPALCSGLGRCGRCRVRFRSQAPEPVPADLARLTPDELEQGWRLGCAHVARPGMELELPLDAPTAHPPPALETLPSGDGFALAVDLGTTSLHWEALDKGETLARGAELNPQMGAGSEVMSRLALAAGPDGAELLRSLVVERLRSIMAALAGSGAGPCRCLSLAGNPAMICLALGKPVSGLAAAPYRLDYAGGVTEPLAEGLPETYVLPLLAPFVGGDLSAGLAHLVADGEPGYPFVLADMGTNGEFVLALSPEEYLAASVALGPALEGVGMAHGTVAGPGAAVAFEASPQGLRAETIDGKTPTGVTGVGYLSLLALLCRVGALDETGRFADASTPLAAKLAVRQDAEHGGEPRLRLPGDLSLWASDVAEVAKVRAAFAVGLARLLEEGGVSPHGLDALYLAGALGEHARPSDLEELGFIPAGLGARVRKAGNTSLAGARLALVRPAVRDWLAALPGRTRLLDLSADPGFLRRFVPAMGLGPWPGKGDQGA